MSKPHFRSPAFCFGLYLLLHPWRGELTRNDTRSSSEFTDPSSSTSSHQLQEVHRVLVCDIKYSEEVQNHVRASTNRPSSAKGCFCWIRLAPSSERCARAQLDSQAYCHATYHAINRYSVIGSIVGSCIATQPQWLYIESLRSNDG